MSLHAASVQHYAVYIIPGKTIASHSFTLIKYLEKNLVSFYLFIYLWIFDSFFRIQFLINYTAWYRDITWYRDTSVGIVS